MSVRPYGRVEGEGGASTVDQFNNVIITISVSGENMNSELLSGHIDNSKCVFSVAVFG